jgi:hypothetical protein
MSRVTNVPSFVPGGELAMRLVNSFHFGFVLSEPELRRTYSVLEQRIQTVIQKSSPSTGFSCKIEVFCENGEENFTSLDDAFSSISNGDSFEIEKLNLIFSANQTQIALRFSKRKDLWSLEETVSYEILGNDRDWVLITSSLLEDRIKATKKLTPIIIPRTPLDLGVLCFTLGVISLFLPYLAPGLPVLFFPWKAFVFVGVPFIIVGCVLRDFFMIPVCNFYWGDYAEKFDRLQSIKSIVYGVLGALVLLGLLGLTRWLSS